MSVELSSQSDHAASTAEEAGAVSNRRRVEIVAAAVAAAAGVELLGVADTATMTMKAAVYRTVHVIPCCRFGSRGHISDALAT